MKSTLIYIILTSMLLTAVACNVKDDMQPTEVTGSNIRFAASGLEETPLADVTLLLFDAKGIYRGTVTDTHNGTLGDYTRMIHCIESGYCLSLLNIENNYCFQSEPVPGKTMLDEIILTRDHDDNVKLPLLGYTRTGKSMNVKVTPLVGVTVVIKEWTVVYIEVDF